MTTRVITSGLVVALGVCGIVPSGSARQLLDGHWEGAITQPAGDLRIAVDLRTRGDVLSGTFDAPWVAGFRWPLTINSAPPKLSLKIPAGIVFEGELRDDAIVGTVRSPSGHTDRFHLKRGPAPPLPYKEEDVRFQSGGFTLAATLRLPLGKGLHPALFLLQGSGPVARESESFYADYFARHGIATLVYDKRGTGASGGDYRDESFNDFAADALAGVHLLQKRVEIDPTRVGLYGRSHGGMVIPLAASLSKEVAFIINVSGAGVSPHQQMTYQMAEQMRRDGFSAADVAEAVTYINQKWDVARRGGEGWDALQATTDAARDKKWLARAQPATKLDDIVPSWKLQMGYDPLPALEGVKCPVLGVFGELDVSTPVAPTIENYEKAFGRSGHKNYTLKVFPGADHALLVWPKPDAPEHWPVLAPGFLETMRQWIHSRAVLRR